MGLQLGGLLNLVRAMEGLGEITVVARIVRNPNGDMLLQSISRFVRQSGCLYES